MTHPPHAARSFRLALRLLLTFALALTAPGAPAPPARAASIVVNSNLDTVINNGQCTLREAITNANHDNQSGSPDCATGSEADAITFSLPVSSTITLNNTLPAITSTITINGPGATLLTISGNNVVRVFDVYSGGALALAGLTVANGNQGVGSGGGIFNDGGVVTITSSTFSSNSTGRGGGIANFDGTLTITNSTFSSNSTTQFHGGGIYNDNGTVTIANSTFSGNSATFVGGGIVNDGGGTLTVTNSTFSDNSADNGGGVFNSDSSTLTITNSTFSGNSASSSGGGLRNLGTATLRNTIVANSPSGGDCSNVGTIGGDNNLVEDSSCGFTNGVDPLLGSLADNGGPTLTRALLDYSPAINDANPANCPPTDQRGVARVGPCDIGAYEYQYTPAPGFLYALQDVSGGANQIYRFQVDTTRHVLVPLARFPVSSGGDGGVDKTAERMAFDAVHARLYVLNDGSDTVSAFAVDPATGALSALPFSPIGLGSRTWQCLAVHPSGSPLVVGAADAQNSLASYIIIGTIATAAPGSPFSTGTASPLSCTFSRDGAYVYTGGYAGTTMAGFSVNASTGVLTALPGSPFVVGTAAPRGYAADSTGRLFVAFPNAQLRAFTTSGGVPTGVSGNPFASNLDNAFHALLHPADFYMVTDRAGNRVGVYQIAGTGVGTTLTAIVGSPFAAGGSQTGILARDPSGAFVFAANVNSRNITAYAMNSGTGALSSPQTQPVDTLGTSGAVTGLVFAFSSTRVCLPLIMK